MGFLPGASPERAGYAGGREAIYGRADRVRFGASRVGQPFDGHGVERLRLRGDAEDGNWYEGEVLGEHMENWLCPALLLYFEKPPKQLYVRWRVTIPNSERASKGRVNGTTVRSRLPDHHRRAQ